MDTNFDVETASRTLASAVTTDNEILTISAADGTFFTPTGPGTFDVVAITELDEDDVAWTVGLEVIVLLPEFVDSVDTAALRDEQRFTELVESVVPTAHATPERTTTLMVDGSVEVGGRTFTLVPGDYEVWLWNTDRGPHGEVICRVGIYPLG